MTRRAKTIAAIQLCAFIAVLPVLGLFWIVGGVVLVILALASNLDSFLRIITRTRP